MENLERSFRVRMVAPSLYKLSTNKRVKLSSDHPLQLSFTHLTRSPQKVITGSSIIAEAKNNEIKLHLPAIYPSPRPDSSTRRSQSLSKTRNEEESPALNRIPSTSPLCKARRKTPEVKRPLKPQQNSGPERNFEYVPVESARILILEPVYAGANPVILFNYPPQCFKPSRLNDRVKGRNDLKLYFHVSSNVHTYNSVVNAFVFAGFTQHDSKYNVLISNVPKIELLKDFNLYQKVNHFPASKHLGRKDNLWKNINVMRRKFKKDFEFCPKTYVLPEDYDVLGVQMEKSAKLWIIKPAASSCGRGIKVIKNFSEVPKKNKYVVCKYIDKPHTINGYKYDLRVYVCVTSFDPLRIFLYKDGLVRFATEQYVKGKKSLHSGISLDNRLAKNTLASWLKAFTLSVTLFFLMFLERYSKHAGFKSFASTLHPSLPARIEKGPTPAKTSQTILAGSKLPKTLSLSVDSFEFQYTELKSKVKSQDPSR